MATTYVGVNVGGQGPADVTIDTSTTSSDVELAIVDTNIPAAGQASKDAILEAIEAIKLAVQEYAY